MSCLFDSPLYPLLFVNHNSYSAIFLYFAKYKYSAKYSLIFLQHPVFLRTVYIIIPQNTYFQLFFRKIQNQHEFFFAKYRIFQINSANYKFRKIQERSFIFRKIQKKNFRKIQILFQIFRKVQSIFFRKIHFFSIYFRIIQIPFWIPQNTEFRKIQ